MLPHRPAPPIPGEKRLNKPADSQRNHSVEPSQTTENVYLTVKEIPQSVIKEEDESSSAIKPTEEDQVIIK
jgi:hypothetical protein